MDIAVLFNLEALSGRRKQQGILPINLLSKLTKQKLYVFKCSHTMCTHEIKTNFAAQNINNKLII